jgi:hypothetical protein
MIPNRTYRALLKLEQTPEQRQYLIDHINGLELNETFATLLSITRLMGVLTIVASAFDAGRDGAL